MSKATLITSRDPRGLKFVSLCEAAFNKAKLDDRQAQRLNENGGEFQASLRELIKRFSVSDQFVSEETRSNYCYPTPYTGPKPIGEQVDLLATLFSLSPGRTAEFIEKVLTTLTLPDGAEGWFAIPSVDAVAKIHFSNVKDLAERYCRAVNLMLEKLAASRKFYNYRPGEMIADRLRVHARTTQALEQIAQQQKGDILIIPGQFGLRHRGRSVRRAREVYLSHEFGFGAFAVGCMLLTHPERLGTSEELWIDCGGDEFAPDAAGQFVSAPYFCFDVGRVKFDTRQVDYALVNCGSASGFSPQ